MKLKWNYNIKEYDGTTEFDNNQKYKLVADIETEAVKERADSAYGNYSFEGSIREFINHIIEKHKPKNNFINRLVVFSNQKLSHPEKTKLRNIVYNKMEKGELPSSFRVGINYQFY